MVHVMQLLPELDPGGAERIVLTLARRLPRDRFTVSLAALDGRGPLADDFREAGCEVHDLGARSRLSPGTIGRLRRLLGERRPTILHSHLFRAHVMAARATRGGSVPKSMATEHQADPRRWALGVLRWATRRTTVVTAVSEGVRQHLLGAGFAAEHVRTVANGIETDAIDRAAPIASAGLALPAEARAGLFVGRLTRQKGLDVLLRAMAGTGRVPSSFHLLVAGDGENRASLEGLARTLRINDRVHFLGRRDDVPRLMKSAEVIILPSRWEGLSLVLLEAMAAGRPVVATRVAGQIEVLKDGESGLLVAPDDAGALAIAIGHVLENRSLAARLGAAARQCVLREYTAEAMVRRYVDLYDEILRSPREDQATARSE